MCIVIRNKKAETDTKHIFYNLYQSINKSAPEDWVTAERNGNLSSNEPWHFYTIKDIHEAKHERMKSHLFNKRERDVIQIRIIYVWVFCCPGLSGCFEGWWIYLKGIDGIYSGGGYKSQVDGHLLNDLIKLFPLIERDFFEVDWDRWMEKFVKLYPRGKWAGKPTGKVPVYAEIYHGRVIRLIRSCQWPRKQGQQALFESKV